MTFSKLGDDAVGREAAPATCFALVDPDIGSVLAVMDSPLPQSHGVWMQIDELDPAAAGDLSDWRVVDSRLERVSLKGARDAAILSVNTTIGQMRGDSITAIVGQEAIYAAKEAEAQRFMSALSPELADHPFLAAEAAATGTDPRALAQTYLTRAALHRARLAALEGLRLGAIATLRAALTPDDIAAALNGFAASIARPDDQVTQPERTASP